MFIQVIDDPGTDSLLLVMEHVDGGSLEQPYDEVSKTWQTLPEALVHRHFRELCKVGQHCTTFFVPGDLASLVCTALQFLPVLGTCARHGQLCQRPLCNATLDSLNASQFWLALSVR